MERKRGRLHSRMAVERKSDFTNIHVYTVLMFSRTLLLPNKEICSRDSYKYLQMKAYINDPSIKFINRPYIE